MAYRNGNYTAFYVDDPFDESNLGANATKDFVYYNLLRAWKGADSHFPFNDSHEKNYSVRDGSDWEKTLKPRIHDRLNNSKNMVFFLSSVTKNSRALREEINFGMGSRGLPVIVVYPEYEAKSDIIDCASGNIRQEIKNLWSALPAFERLLNDVPTIHIPNKKDLIRNALNDSDFMISSKCAAGQYSYKC
jgi:Thoeris protein ThsB, TIR-like domain